MKWINLLLFWLNATFATTDFIAHRVNVLTYGCIIISIICFILFAVEFLREIKLNAKKKMCAQLPATEEVGYVGQDRADEHTKQAAARGFGIGPKR